MHRIAILAILAIIAGCKQDSELAGLAGEYYQGDGLGVNCTLSLREPNRFDFQWRGCLGSYDKNNGTAQCIDKTLHLKPSLPNSREGFQGIATEFFVISWGSRQYLVAHDEMLEYCNAINQGSEPRGNEFGFFYMRSGDWGKPVSGKPAIVGDWSEYLLDEPVRGEISSILGQETVEVNIGTNQGLRPGMMLTAQRVGSTMYSQLVVAELESDSCRASIKHPGLSTISVGQPVSTRFIDRTEN